MRCDPLSASTRVISENRETAFRDHGPGSPRATAADDQSRLTGGGRDLGGEIGFLLLDALTECVADKTGDFDRSTHLAFGFLQRLRHTLLVIENKWLLQQTNFLVERLESRLDDLIDYVSRFALLLELVGKHILLTLHNGRIERCGIERQRFGGCNVHRDLATNRRQFVGLATRFERHDHPDLAQAIGNRVVYVGTDHSLPDGQGGGPAQRHVLADLRDRVGNRLRHRYASRVRGLELLDFGSDRKRDVGDHLDQTLEQVIACNEVGLRVELDHDAFRAYHLNANQTFGRNATGLFSRLGQAFLA